MKLQPMGNNVILVRKEAEKETAGGLIIPANAQKKSNEAVVVAAGPGKINDTGALIPMSVETGVTVLIGKWAGTELEIEGQSHLIVPETEILAILGD
jgi:chaperonin GroES